MKTFLNRLEKWMLYLITILLFGIVFLLAAQIFVRNVMGTSIHWSDEIARYLLIWMSMLGAALGIRYLSHVNMDFVMSLLPPRLRVGLAVICDLIVLGFVLVFMYRSFFYTIEQFFIRSTTAGIPMGIPYISLPIAGLLMIVFLLEKMIPELKQLFGKSNPTNQDAFPINEGTGI